MTTDEFCVADIPLAHGREGGALATSEPSCGLGNQTLSASAPDVLLWDWTGTELRGIPVFHMKAGSWCLDARVPEEANHWTIDPIGRINTPTATSLETDCCSEDWPPTWLSRRAVRCARCRHTTDPRPTPPGVLRRLELIEENEFAGSAYCEPSALRPKAQEWFYSNQDERRRVREIKAL